MTCLRYAIASRDHSSDCQNACARSIANAQSASRERASSNSVMRRSASDFIATSSAGRRHSPSTKFRHVTGASPGARGIGRPNRYGRRASHSASESCNAKSE